jgi:hypothetical protein
MGDAIKLIGKGLTRGKVHEPILNAEQLETLEATPEKEPFDGDPSHFRLGIEALRLCMAAHRLPAKELKYFFIAVMAYMGLKMIGVFGWLGLPM